MNLPRDVVGVLREDAVSLEGCHDVTSRGGEGGKETRLSAVTRGASVMSAPSRFHLHHKTSSAPPGHGSSFPHLEVLDEHRNLTGLPDAPSEWPQHKSVSMVPTPHTLQSLAVPVPRTRPVPSGTLQAQAQGCPGLQPPLLCCSWLPSQPGSLGVG